MKIEEIILGNNKIPFLLTNINNYNNQNSKN